MACLLTGRTVAPGDDAGYVAGRFDDYQAARRAVDRLSDDGSPVDRLDIVGSDLRLVERATCRMTRARATGPARCPA